jgi:hypothetical protein
MPDWLCWLIILVGGVWILLTLFPPRDPEFWLFFRSPLLLWLAVERSLRYYLEHLTPAALFRNNEGWFVASEFALLVAFLIWGPAPWIPPASGYLVLDLLVSNTIIVFVTGRPIHPLRSVVLTVGGYANLGLAFAVLWVGYVCDEVGSPRVWTAIYQSFRTLGTMGPEQHLLRSNAQGWIFQALIASELAAGIYFLGLILATYASWASRKESR